jgi:hypothetical protein
MLGDEWARDIGGWGDAGASREARKQGSKEARKRRSGEGKKQEAVKQRSKEADFSRGRGFSMQRSNVDPVSLYLLSFLSRSSSLPHSSDLWLSIHPHPLPHFIQFNITYSETNVR